MPKIEWKWTHRMRRGKSVSFVRRLEGENEMVKFDSGFYKGKKVLITGHTGFKGSWLCQILLRLGADVTGYALEPPTDPGLFTICRLSEKIRSVIGDIRDLEHLRKVFEETEPEIVIHMAAQPLVRESYKNPVYTYETNVMGTVNVLECVRSTPSVKSFLNVTTDKVYQNKEWEWGYRENEQLRGLDPYSNSKSCSELVTYSYRKSFFQDGETAISTARAGNVIGGGDFARDRIIPDCVRAALAQNDIDVRNPYSVRPYQYVIEPLFAYLMIAGAQYEDAGFAGSYNVGPEEKDCITTGQLVSLFCREWGEGLKWNEKAQQGPHEANFLKLDCSKIKKTFEWSPTWGIEEAVRKTVRWAKVYEQKGDIQKEMDSQIEEFLNCFI